VPVDMGHHSQRFNERLRKKLRDPVPLGAPRRWLANGTGTTPPPDLESDLRAIGVGGAAVRRDPFPSYTGYKKVTTFLPLSRPLSPSTLTTFDLGYKVTKLQAYKFCIGRVLQP